MSSPPKGLFNNKENNNDNGEDTEEQNALSKRITGHVFSKRENLPRPTNVHSRKLSPEGKTNI